MTLKQKKKDDRVILESIRGVAKPGGCLVLFFSRQYNGSHGSFHSRENAGSYGTEWEVSKETFDTITWLGIVV